MSRAVTLVSVLTIVAAAAGYAYYKSRVASTGPVHAAVAPPISVSTQVVGVGPMIDSVSAYGNLVSRRSVKIVPQASGLVKQIFFTEGQTVAAGAPLVLIDPSVALAQLQSARAQAETDEQNLRRTQSLSKQGLDSTSSLEQAQARMSASQADVKISELKLQQLTLLAPFAGTLGSSDIDVGAFVTPADTIVRLQQTDELQIEFRMPSSVASRVASGMKVHILAPQADSNQSVDGKLSFIDPAISTDTRSILLRALVPNVGLHLRPGVFVRATLDLSVHPNALIVPDVAVNRDLNGANVFVIDTHDVAHERAVTIGLVNGSQVELTSGVAAGEQVVTVGQFRLHDGDLVRRVTVSADKQGAS